MTISVTKKFPTQISLQADLEFEVLVSSALLDEFDQRSEGFMNLQVGFDLPIFPNIYNLILLTDSAGEREPILTQCRGFYDPEVDELQAGEIPVVQLSRNIEPVPDSVLDFLTAADPRILETGSDQGTVITSSIGVL